MGKGKESGFSGAKYRSKRRLTSKVASTDAVIAEVNALTQANLAEDYQYQNFLERKAAGRYSESEINAIEAEYHAEALDLAQAVYIQEKGKSPAWLDGIYEQNELAKKQLAMIKNGQGVLL